MTVGLKEKDDSRSEREKEVKINYEEIYVT